MIFGQVSPSGKLAQSIPLDISDDPSTLNWPGEEGHVDYGEGVFVGYRYYDTYGKVVVSSLQKIIPGAALRRCGWTEHPAAPPPAR